MQGMMYPWTFGKRVSDYNLADFRMKHKRLRSQTYTYETMEVAWRTKDAYLYVPQNEDYIPNVIEIALDTIKNSTDAAVTCAMLTSVVSAYVPQLREPFVNAMLDQGINLTEKLLPADEEEAYIYRDVYNKAEIMTVLGFALLLMFKNVTNQNFDTFIQRRVDAIAGKLGVNRREFRRLGSVIKLEQAEHIKEILGSSLELKRHIIQFFLYNMKSPSLLGSLSSYCASILEWNELKFYVFIFNKLCLTQSPVLSHPDIQHEVYHYAETMVKILSSDWPPYFRYFSDGHENLLSRSRITILAKVANVLKDSEMTGSASENFVSTSTNHSLVDKLVRQHKIYIANYQMGPTRSKTLLQSDPRITEIDDTEPNRIINDRETGRSRGFGFVKVEVDMEAQSRRGGGGGRREGGGGFGGLREGGYGGGGGYGGDRREGGGGGCREGGGGYGGDRREGGGYSRG